MEKRYYHADGHVIWVMLSVCSCATPPGEHPLLDFPDSGHHHRKQREHALRDQAEQSRDRVDGPAYRVSTRRAWDVAIAERMRSRHDTPRCSRWRSIDLDGLKEMNYTHGHHAGYDALARTSRPSGRRGVTETSSPASAATSSRSDPRGERRVEPRAHRADPRALPGHHPHLPAWRRGTARRARRAPAARRPRLYAAKGPPARGRRGSRPQRTQISETVVSGGYRRVRTYTAPESQQPRTALGNGVMAARDALDVEVGVRVPVPQLQSLAG